MEYRRLGGELDVPVIGMGTWLTFDVSSESDLAVRRDIVGECVSHGVTLIDSSPMYGKSEAVIGVTTEASRGKFVLATKVWMSGKAEGEAQIARSFESMKTHHMDVLQIHNLLDWRVQLPTLEGLKEEGKIGLVGLTHNSAGAYPEMMDIMRTGRVDCIQIPYNVVNRAAEEKVLPLAADMGIGVLVMEPLQKGRYVGGLRAQPDLSPLSEFGIKTWAQALLAWVVSNPAVTSAIPATTRPERIAENAVAGDAGHLPRDIREYIREETERCL